RVLEVLSVVALGEVGTLVRAARLAAGQGAEGHGLGCIEQEPQLQGGRQLGVKAVALVADGDLPVALFELPKRVARAAQRFLGAVDAGPRLHRLVQRDADASDRFLPFAAEPTLDELALLVGRLSLKGAGVEAGVAGGEADGAAGGAGAEHE